MASSMERIAGSFKKGSSETVKFINSMVEKLSSIEKTCTICEKIDWNIEKFIDVILYLFFKEPDFKELFMAKKGFCLPHVKRLLEGSLKYLIIETAVSLLSLMSMQLVHMDRIRKKYTGLRRSSITKIRTPVGNSQDAVPRSIER